MLDNSRIKPLEYTNSFKNYETQKKLNKKCDFTFLKLYKYMKNVTIIIIIIKSKKKIFCSWIVNAIKICNS